MARGRPFPYKVGDVINGVEILRIYKRADVKEHRRNYCAVACVECGLIREGIHPCDLRAGRRRKCKGCTKGIRKENALSHTKEYAVYHSAKRRAKLYDIKFEIELSDIVIPKVCPLLNIPLVLDSHIQLDASPSLDRIIPSKGYVKGNIIVISQRANRIKNDSSIDELMLLTENLHNLIVSGLA